MSLIRQVPIQWETPSSWTRHGWDMDSFNPERQLDMLDREMRDMNVRSGLRDMNMHSDNRISNTRSGSSDWSSSRHDNRSVAPSMRSDIDRWSNSFRDNNMSVVPSTRSDFDRWSSGHRDNSMSVVPSTRSDFDRWSSGHRDNSMSVVPSMRSDIDRWANGQQDNSWSVMPRTTSSFDRWSSSDNRLVPFQWNMPMLSYDGGTFQHSMRQMDREMKQMTDEMSRMFSHCQHLIPVDSVPETWRSRENYLLENPIIHGRDGKKKFQLQFDVRQFKPEEIEVKTSGRQLSVHARHEEKGEGRSVFREYNRQYTVPADINPEMLVSKLGRDGLLSIEAPLPEVEESLKLIPIEHKK